MPRKGKAGKVNRKLVVKKALHSLLDLWVVPKGGPKPFYGPFSAVQYDSTMLFGIHNGQRLSVAHWDPDRYQWQIGTKGGLPVYVLEIEITSERPKKP